MTSQLMGNYLSMHCHPQSLGDQSWHSCMYICLLWCSIPVNHMSNSVNLADEGEYS